MSEVRVRFVPRGRTSLSFSDFESAPSDVLSNQIEPTKSQMERGRRLLLDRQVATAETPKNRLEVSLTRKEFSQIFQGSQLSNRSSQSRETARLDVETLTQHESYLSTNDLKVPEALQDAIAFAYIPRPVEYHSVLSIPPRENLHYLRLSDVAMAMNAPRCHQQGLMGQKIRVAMADSGFWLHPHFIRSGARLIPTESPGSGAATEDASGHGTGEAANIFAIAPQCTVYGVKHGGSSAGTLETCIAQKPHVMTNSWGFNIDHQTRESLRQSDRQMFNELLDLEQIISSAVDDGIAVLFSAGNGHLAFPASFPDVISVGGVTVTEACS
ncbi:MAG: S8 family serine peptidase [Bacteroidota bacterium]